MTRALVFAVSVTVALSAGCGSSGSGKGDAADSGTDSTDATDTAAEAPCFPCEGYWICGGDPPRIDLTPAADGCFLSGLSPGRNILAGDGTITEDGAVVGKAVGTGARVQVSYPDGGQWTFCAGGGGCR